MGRPAGRLLKLSYEKSQEAGKPSYSQDPSKCVDAIEGLELAPDAEAHKENRVRNPISDGSLLGHPSHYDGNEYDNQRQIWCLAYRVATDLEVVVAAHLETLLENVPDSPCVVPDASRWPELV